MLALFFALPMLRFTPSLFERLLDDQAHVEADPMSRGLSLDQMKASVARDVESLLNSRVGLVEDRVRPFPLSRSSVLTYGLRDFAGASFENVTDQDEICAAIQRSIERHEPRLRNVSVALHEGEKRQLLNFSVNAMLVVDPAVEPVSFDAFLQPTTHQYAVALSAR